MPRSFLLTVPEDDLRPAERSAAVIKRAVEAHVVEIKGWLGKDFKYTDLDEIAGALEEANGDSFEAAYTLKLRNGLPVDKASARILFAVEDSYGFHHRMAQIDWVLRAKVRVPAKDGERIEYQSQHGALESAKVISINRPQAYVIVEPSWDHRVKVPAEKIIANLTRSLYPDVPGAPPASARLSEDFLDGFGAAGG